MLPVLGWFRSPSGLLGRHLLVLLVGRGHLGVLDTLGMRAVNGSAGDSLGTTDLVDQVVLCHTLFVSDGVGCGELLAQVGRLGLFERQVSRYLGFVLRQGVVDRRLVVDRCLELGQLGVGRGQLVVVASGEADTNGCNCQRGSKDAKVRLHLSGPPLM